MGMFDILRIPATGMAAERLRMQVIAENLANANSTKGADGQPYRRKAVVLQEARGRRRFGEVLGGVEAVGHHRGHPPGAPRLRPVQPRCRQDGLRHAAERRLGHRDGRPDHRRSAATRRTSRRMNAAKQMFSRTPRHPPLMDPITRPSARAPSSGSTGRRRRAPASPVRRVAARRMAAGSATPSRDVAREARRDARVRR